MLAVEKAEMYAERKAGVGKGYLREGIVGGILYFEGPLDDSVN